ncbi:hypothetical protein AMTR_s00022p00194460 [Amborella trichopoda]|uniref:Serine-threonine/tyrosine-protein kinase catalytic domain-containing protein n=1 Tax=Amborella trichopoda TaxID=13333 RepID=W1PWB5_AMBTC|nr:hypothetical protein AMTR_s00022p00194460 [Amborella trichopoda]
MHIGREVRIAVKKLDELVERREKVFRTELSAIGRTCHKNLVRLLGFCDDGDQRLLVYDFRPNGYLASFPFGTTKPSWGERIQLPYGIAIGIMYLHEDCEIVIYIPKMYFLISFPPQRLQASDWQSSYITTKPIQTCTLEGQTDTWHRSGVQMVQSLRRWIFLVLRSCCSRSYVVGGGLISINTTRD